MRLSLGRHVFGLAAILFGVITLVWRDFNNWQQIQVLGDVPHREILVYLAAAIEIFGGVAIQFRKTARVGAVLSVNPVNVNQARPAIKLPTHGSRRSSLPAKRPCLH
jgi:uncharacterized membrane protein